MYAARAKIVHKNTGKYKIGPLENYAKKTITYLCTKITDFIHERETMTKIHAKRLPYIGRQFCCRMYR